MSTASSTFHGEFINFDHDIEVICYLSIPKR